MTAAELTAGDVQAALLTGLAVGLMAGAVITATVCSWAFSSRRAERVISVAEMDALLHATTRPIDLGDLTDKELLP